MLNRLLDVVIIICVIIILFPCTVISPIAYIFWNYNTVHLAVGMIVEADFNSLK